MSTKESLEKAAALFGDPHEPKCVVITEESKQKIVGDGFDINKHEFGDTVLFVECEGCKLTIYCDDDFGFVELYKLDAIAIAKALGVTGDDLK